jgi:D-arginine dehydrogenase
VSTADVIVIGGGIAGISAGALLAEDMSVLVLEAEPHPGYHATGRSAAIFIRNYGNKVLRSLNAASAGFFENPQGVAEDSLLSPRGEMLVATEDEVNALEDYADGASGLERLTSAEATELVPILRPDLIAAAAIEWDAQDIDVDRMLTGYARLLKDRGGRLATGQGVCGLWREDGLWHVDCGAEAFSAPIVVNAAGAWAGCVAEMAGISARGIQPYRRSAAVLPAPDGHDLTRWPLFASASERWYAKPEAGKLMVSPADEDAVEPHDAWVDDMVLAEGLYRFEQAVQMEVTRVEHSWAGLRTFTPDRTPLVGFEPEHEGFFWLAGQGGYGVQTAPALAALARDLITRTQSELPQQVVEALNPARAMP